jgi:hypothetical protein
MTADMILISQEAAQLIKTSGLWGHLSLRISEPDALAGVISVSEQQKVMRPAALEPRNHVLRGAGTGSGVWYRVGPELHAAALLVSVRSSGLTLEGFRGHVPSGFKTPGAMAYYALTYAPGVHDPPYNEGQIPELMAWHVSADGAWPISTQVEPQTLGLSQLAPSWPVAELSEATVMLVGAGSIGGAAAHALALYGVGNLLLVDPDRLGWHNLVRHVTSSRHVGRYKVDALADEMAKIRSETRAEALRLDVVVDADRIRPLLRRTHVVLCAADGIAPRRVVSHLARRAGIDAVLACVLQDGAFGEILRLRPWADRGCLVCERETLATAGGMDIEPSLDAGYGTGSRHRPMTAVGGDLHLVGQLAAKVAVATVLERRGQADQRLPGEHTIWALRPQPGATPPFDLSRSGELHWSPAHPPRPGCPTCQAP